MPNIIKFPLYASGSSLVEPKYTFVNVSDLFKIDVAVYPTDDQYYYGFDFIYKKSGNSSNNIYIASRLLYVYVSLINQETPGTNMNVELERLRLLIKRSSSAPNSQPIFELLPTPKSKEVGKAYIHHIDRISAYLWSPPA
tara:strand:- start:334 stop:753 length:420 start_codon:yes stop_codon:yes gene_type:complete